MPTPPPSGTSASGVRRMMMGAAIGIGDWLPIVGACGLLAHLSLLGLRPALEERAFLEERRERIADERAGLETDLQALERYEHALDDPIFRERLRWQWRLSAGTSHAGTGHAEEVGGGDSSADSARSSELPSGIELLESQR